AVYVAVNQKAHKLPLARLVNTGSSPNSNDMVWRGMQGVIGIGSGAQVERELEKRSRAWPPRYKR
ncbi:MAG TPA: hypothetical protein VMZ91_01720, partial [Candidatus Paceibacterota bacterium]|nr:hypothetical protein [Candidatus Paceibacterota bacterium]